MQFLKEIIGLSYFHFYPVIDEFVPQGAKNQQLYLAIRDGEVTTDQEASRLIYGNESVEKKYIMLKKRLKQQVTDNYFRLLSQANDVVPSSLQGRLDYLKQLTIIHTLMGQGRYSIARQLLHYQQKAAITQLDLTALQEGLHLLRRIASYQGERVAFRRHDAQLKEVTQQIALLQKVQGYYEAVRLEHRRCLAPSASVAKLARQYVDEVQQSQQYSPHPLTGFYIRALKMVSLFHEGNVSGFRRMLFFQRQHTQRYPVLSSYDTVTNADLLVMEYLSAQRPQNQWELVHMAIKDSRDESLPMTAWLELRSVECIHWLRTVQYQQALKVCQQLESEVEEETLVMSPHDRGQWMLFRTYTSYLLRRTLTEVFQPSASPESLATIEIVIQPLLTDTPGYGWQWLILKMLLWIENPFVSVKYFLRQIDAYARRHMAEQSERSRLFFQKVRATIAEQPSRLSSGYSQPALPPPSGHDRLRELIPYEILWESTFARDLDQRDLPVDK